MVRPLWLDDERAAQAGWAKYHKWIKPGDPAYFAVMHVFREYELAGVPVDNNSARIAVQLGKSRHQMNSERRAEQDREWAQQEEERKHAIGYSKDIEGAVVYYIRRGDFIKIGTTVRLRSRMTSLRPDEILAIEPGSYSLERERHRQFRDTRIGNQSEYFAPCPALTEHMAAIRAQHGVPDQRLLKLTDGRRFFNEQQTRSA